MLGFKRGSFPLYAFTIVSRNDQETPRELRNRAEKQRRDKMNQSISDLAAIVPPVAIPARKIDKTSTLRLTAHYLRSHQYVFGDSINRGRNSRGFSLEFTKTLLKTLKGFLITITYKGLIVVVSPNVQQYLGYSELELLGQNIFNYVHVQDHNLLRERLMPPKIMMGLNGELLVPQDDEGRARVEYALSNEKRNFTIRFKRPNQQRTGPIHYVTCHIQGTLRKADKAGLRYNRYSQIIRRARFRGETPRSSGNDVVFIGIARPTTETFMTESILESFKMEYRTRHSIDGQIIQCEQRIALVTGYMTHEVSGVNAMNFMHRDDVRWVIVALREMYDENRLYGESCYRLMTKNGKFIYMRTRGRLDVDRNTNAVTSFMCVNTVVTEEEGKQLIQSMKKRFMLIVNNGEDKSETNALEEKNDKAVAVEDPEQLQEVILHLVTNLPSQNNNFVPSTINEDIGFSRLSIIPPKKDRILDAILKSSSVIGNMGQNEINYVHSETSNVIGIRRPCIDNNDIKTPTKMSKSDDMSDESLLEFLQLDSGGEFAIADMDANGINYKDILEEAQLDKQSYFENID
ncbi:unnamed protein product [Leptosia nina]|uniref:Uncharacterized protein n=1 Tax=Leptosia nina TaxID=320188 RepID=A0AAV1K2C7_9NEOP